MKRPILLLAAALSLCPAAPSPAGDVTDLDRFQLWNDCRPMYLVVETLDRDADDIGLTREAIGTAARSRLRAARLYDGDAVAPYLYVNVNVSRSTFGLSVEYNKWMSDPASGESGAASTWDRGAIGTHGGDAGYILSSVSQIMDIFIDEYLRVNEDACPR